MAGNGSYNLLGARVFIAGCAVLLAAAFPIAEITIGIVYMYECPAAPVIPVYVMVCGILALLIMGLLAVPKLPCPAAQGKIWTLCIISLGLFVFIWFLYGSYQIYSVYPPNYTKFTTDPNSFNNSFYTTTVPNNKHNLTLENHNQSLPNLNQTGMINNNQTLKNPIQTMAHINISSKTKREHLNTPRAHHVMTAVPYCDRTVYLFAFWTTTLVYVFAGNALMMTTCVSGFMKITN